MEHMDFDSRRDLRERRSLYLTEWELNVSSTRQLHAKWTEVASEFGQTFLKSSFLLNGGALIALPPLMQWLDAAQRQLVFSVSIFFVIGLVLAAAGTALAYFNFTFLAALNDTWSSLRAKEVNNYYASASKNLDDDKEYKNLQKWQVWQGRAVTLTQALAVIVGLASYVVFYVGVTGFKELVEKQSSTTEESSLMTEEVSPTKEESQ